MSDLDVRISMSEVGDLIYDYMKEFKYVFAVLGRSEDVLNSIKEIIYERKLTSCIGVIMLLKVRQPELFVDLGFNVPNSDERFLRNVEFSKINTVSDFSENDSQYQFVNYCLKHGSVLYSTILNYERVVSEIDRIKSMVNAKEDGMFFLKGL